MSRVIDFPRSYPGQRFDSDNVRAAFITPSTLSWEFNSAGHTTDGQYVEGPTLTSLLGATPSSFGFSVWIRPRIDHADFDSILGASSDWINWDDGFGLHFTSATGVGFFINLYTGDSAVTGTLPVSNSVWVNIVGTFDGASGEMHLWINGTKTSETSDIAATMTSAGDLRMAAIGDANVDQEFKGHIDEFVLFSDVLTDADANFMYTNGDLDNVAAPDNVVVWYRFGEEAADDVTTDTGQLTDASGNGNHGTPRGATDSIDQESVFPP